MFEISTTMRENLDIPFCDESSPRGEVVRQVPYIPPRRVRRQVVTEDEEEDEEDEESRRILNENTQRCQRQWSITVGVLAGVAIAGTIAALIYFA
jgi:hypothetical protein